METETIAVQRDDVADVSSVEDAKQQYVDGDLTEWELERLVESALAVEQNDTDSDEKAVEPFDGLPDVSTGDVVQTVLWTTVGFALACVAGGASLFITSTAGVPLAVFLVTFAGTTIVSLAETFDVTIEDVCIAIVAVIVGIIIAAFLIPVEIGEVDR